MDEKYMRMALDGAKKAAQAGEVPVGAILVDHQGQVISHGFNLRENWQTSLAHAEIIALQRASRRQGQWRLLNTTLYVTLEPCAMCAGALVQARIGRLVFGASDPKAGAVQSLYQICSDPRLNHQMLITAGVLKKECSEILTQFFRKRRAEKKRPVALPSWPNCST